jgi:hypothetical protein
MSSIPFSTDARRLEPSQETRRQFLIEELAAFLYGKS